MSYYKKLLPLQNKSRLNKLFEFRSLVLQYFNSSEANWMIRGRIEQPQAEVAREKINRMMGEVHRIILNAGFDPSLRYTPPPAIGGNIQDVDLIINVFNLNNFDIPAKELIDCIDRVIGIYQNNQRPALLRAINPFFYLNLIFDLLATIPFIIIGRVGFNRQRVEASFGGRFFKGSIYLIGVLASLLTVLQNLDYLKDVVKKLFSF